MVGRVVSEGLHQLGIPVDGAGGWIDDPVDGVQVIGEVGKGEGLGEAVLRDDVDRRDIDTEFELMPPNAMAEAVDEIVLVLEIVLVGRRVGAQRRHAGD